MPRTEIRPRVAHVVGGLGVGGGQKLTALVATGLKHRGYDVTVLNLGGSGFYETYLEENQVPVISFGMSDGGGPRGFARNVLLVIKLWRTLARHRWEVVHTHMFRTALVTTPVARLLGARVFGTSHRIYYSRWQPVLELMLSKLQEAVVVDSAAVAEILRAETGISNYHVIHNGIDTREFDRPIGKAVARRRLGLNTKATVILCVAHLVPHKGQQHLLEAFSALAAEQPDAELLLVGDGPMREELRRRADVLRLSGKVHLTGSTGDLACVLAAADILCLPSTFEGFGIVQAEAMYLKLPVVATNRGGSSEVVDEGVTGYLVPFGDVRALSSRLLCLLQRPDLRQRLGLAGRRRVLERFTQNAMVDAYDRLYVSHDSVGK